MASFDPETARQREAERRLKLLGDLASGEYNHNGLRDRARVTNVPYRVLRSWWQTYKSQGLPGLIPQDWTELDEKAQRLALARYEQLGALADTETITPDEIAALADRNEWSYLRAARWLRRYRIGGLWALAPEQPL